MISQHSASLQATGYIYQVRYALFALLNTKTEGKIRIEGLDDIEFEEDGNPTELLQLKHKTHPATITDSSPDFWKSLLIWMELDEAKEIDVENIILTLVTTAQTQADTALYSIRPSKYGTRDINQAINFLLDIANTSSNKALQGAFEKFKQLDETARFNIVSAIEILDGSANILDIENEIKDKLRWTVLPEHLDNLYTRLEGWWFGKAIRQLSGKSEHFISSQEVHFHITDLASQFRPEALPIDFFSQLPDEEPDPDNDERLFVRQLREIVISRRRIELAIIDYYRAFEQRSRWISDELIFDEELENYERKLVEEWDRLRWQILEKASQSDNEEYLISLGKEIYNLVENTNFPIRKEVTEEYISRGSFHILASSIPPKVFWHPEFLNRIEDILITSG